jgi:hypothetical protein
MTISLFFAGTISKKNCKRLRGIIPSKYKFLQAVEWMYLGHLDSMPELPASNTIMLLVQGEPCNRLLIYDDLASHLKARVLRSVMMARLESFCKNLPSFTCLDLLDVHQPLIKTNARITYVMHKQSTDQPAIVGVDFLERWGHPFPLPKQDAKPGSHSDALLDSDKQDKFLLKGELCNHELFQSTSPLIDKFRSVHSIDELLRLLCLIVKVFDVHRLASSAFLQLSLGDCLFSEKNQQIWIPNKSCVNSNTTYEFRVLQSLLRQSNRVCASLIDAVDQTTSLTKKDFTWKLSQPLIETQVHYSFGMILVDLIRDDQCTILRGYRDTLEKLALSLVHGNSTLDQVWESLSALSSSSAHGLDQVESFEKLELSILQDSWRRMIGLRIPFWLFDAESGYSNLSGFLCGKCKFAERPEYCFDYELVYQDVQDSPVSVDGLQHVLLQIGQIQAEERKRMALKHVHRHSSPWAVYFNMALLVHDFTHTQIIIPDDVRVHLLQWNKKLVEIRRLLFFLYDPQGQLASHADEHLLEQMRGLSGLARLFRIGWIVAKLQQFLKNQFNLYFDLTRISEGLNGMLMVNGLESLTVHTDEHDDCWDFGMFLLKRGATMPLPSFEKPQVNLSDENQSNKRFEQLLPIRLYSLVDPLLHAEQSKISLDDAVEFLREDRSKVCKDISPIVATEYKIKSQLQLVRDSSVNRNLNIFFRAKS